MIRTIISLLLTTYSMARLVLIVAMYYYEQMRLPLSVIIVTLCCCIAVLIIVGLTYLRQLSGRNLRFALLLTALAAGLNMVLLLVSQPGSLNDTELIVTGTMFDILFFLGACTIQIRDTKNRTDRTPFSRAAQKIKRRSSNQVRKIRK